MYPSCVHLGLRVHFVMVIEMRLQRIVDTTFGVVAFAEPYACGPRRRRRASSPLEVGERTSPALTPIRPTEQSTPLTLMAGRVPDRAERSDCPRAAATRGSSQPSFPCQRPRLVTCADALDMRVAE